jgi:ABC-type nitrate/sulfonate/bicarbonate transport system permease component
MNEFIWKVARALFPFLVVGLAYEIFARSGYMKPVLTPSLLDVAATFERLVANGELLQHAAATLARRGSGSSWLPRQVSCSVRSWRAAASWTVS